MKKRSTTVKCLIPFSFYSLGTELVCSGKPVQQGQEKLTDFRYLFGYKYVDVSKFKKWWPPIEWIFTTKEAGLSDLHIFSHSSMPNSHLTISVALQIESP